MEGLRIAAASFCFLSLLLLIIALASNYWVVSTDGDHGGLWYTCWDHICKSYGMEAQDYIHATQAFMLMEMLAGAASFFGLCTSFYHTHIGSISTKGLAFMASFVAGGLAYMVVRHTTQE